MERDGNGRRREEEDRKDWRGRRKAPNQPKMSNGPNPSATWRHWLGFQLLNLEMHASVFKISASSWHGGANRTLNLRFICCRIESCLGTIAQWPWASYVHLCASVTKQYNLVLVKGRWRSEAGKVTIGLATNWPCVTGRVSQTLWFIHLQAQGPRKRDEHPA